MTEYPQRRPYATTLNHSGYLAKPQTIGDFRPPTEALRILNSQIGYDAPRNSRPRTAGGRLPELLSEQDSVSLSQQRQLADHSLFPDSNRSLQDALSAAKLEGPFQFNANNYHSSQQSVLNAELRHKVDKFMADWGSKLAQLKKILDHYPTDGGMINYNTTEVLKAYFTAYRCTEDLTVPIQRLIDDFNLTTSQEDIQDIEAIPVLPFDNIGRSLDSLLTSDYLLAPLDQYASSLEVYDLIAQPEKEHRGDKDGIEHDENGNVLGPVCPSTTAVVLHERFHYNPGEYSLKELSKSEKPLLEMETRVLTAKHRKEDAIDAMNPIEALRNLHAQVDYSNDLLLMNKARMALVALHAEDVRDMRASVVRVVEDANRAADMIRARVEELLPKIVSDMSRLREEIESTHNVLTTLEEKEAVAGKAMRDDMRAIDDKEKDLWSQMQRLMSQLLESAEHKTKLARRHMSLRETRSKEYCAVQQLLKAQEGHLEHLSECEDLVNRWQQGGDVYQRYVDAFIPKLLKRMNQIEEEDEDLSNREAQDYVRRYEMFTYGAEEARAKRSVQADRMRLTQRSMIRNQEVAEETLDPANEQHIQRFSEAGKELEEVLAYIDYIETIETDRRSEVEPVLRRVMAYNLYMQTDSLQIEQEEALRLDGEKTASANVNNDAAAKGYVVAAVEAEAAPMAATIQHPYVTARMIGLSHMEGYVEMHLQLNNDELSATEEKADGIRRSKTELSRMADKYKNSDYIRSLLLAVSSRTDQ